MDYLILVKTVRNHLKSSVAWDFQGVGFFFVCKCIWAEKCLIKIKGQRCEKYRKGNHSDEIILCFVVFEHKF
jgi:hypothetical protein